MGDIKKPKDALPANKEEAQKRYDAAQDERTEFERKAAERRQQMNEARGKRRFDPKAKRRLFKDGSLMPNVLYWPRAIFEDGWWASWSGSEKAIIGVLVWKTYGYEKRTDKVSLSQLIEFSGVGRDAALKAIKSLEAVGAIGVARKVLDNGDKDTNEYELLIKDR